MTPAALHALALPFPAKKPVDSDRLGGAPEKRWLERASASPAHAPL